jgi:hypothetical protein
MTVQQEIVDKINKRVEKGKLLATSKTIYRIVNTDVFYVESQTTDGLYYYAMFNTAKDFEWCSCKSFEHHHEKCKHLQAIEFAIRKATVIDIDKLPKEVKRL